VNPKDVKTAPEPTLRRLPSYHHLLKRLELRGRAVVSCTHIAAELKLDPTQVRKDLAVTGIIGKPKVGYEVPMLVEAIESFLGWNNVSEAFLVGAGSLGSALLGYEGFKHYGLNIIAAFDTAPAKIGTRIHGRQVLSVQKLPDLARRMHILIGILTVPGEAAQAAADLMVSGGIKAIWNFAPAALNVPDDVIVENQELSAGLAVLSSKLSAALHMHNIVGGVSDATDGADGGEVHTHGAEVRARV
jgi:redox-sensing transcriptional repressor